MGLDKLLKEADLRGMNRKETLYRYSNNYDLDDKIDYGEFQIWIREMEREFLLKNLSIRFGRWLRMIVKMRNEKKESN